GRVDPVDFDTAPSIAVPDPAVHTSAWSRSTIAEPAEGWRVLVATAVREREEARRALVAPAGLAPSARWVRPVGMPRRGHTYCDPTAAGELSSAPHRTTEAHTSEWRSVTGILNAEDDGRLKLMRPTFVLLRELVDYSSVAEALRA